MRNPPIAPEASSATSAAGGNDRARAGVGGVARDLAGMTCVFCADDLESHAAFGEDVEHEPQTLDPPAPSGWIVNYEHVVLIHF